MSKENYQKILNFVLLGLVYFVTGKLGLMLASANPSVSAVWPSTGVALAALLYFGYEYWAAILVGAFFVNFFTTQDVPSSLLIGIGNTLEALIGSYLINKYAGGIYFYDKSINVKKFILFTFFATALTASIGAISLIINDFDTWTNFSLIWFNWWVGDMAGAIIVTPMLLLLFAKHINPKGRSQILERIAFIFCVMLVSMIVFGNVFESHPMGFLLIPLLVWPGVRFSQRESAMSNFLIAAVAIFGTVVGTGPFTEVYTDDPILMLQAYLATISLTSLILAASVAERKDSESLLADAYDTALVGWSKALDFRDKETEGHSLRVAEICVRLGSRLGLSETDLLNIKQGALLHDIGKMAISDKILYKPGPLNEEEWQVMRKHPVYAADFLSNLSYSKAAKDIPFSHHEKWDGTGYPQGLKGEEIPLFARIFCVVDVWDALRSNRPYRTALSDAEVIKYMEGLSGTHFDPKIIDVFIEMVREEAIHHR